MENKIIKARAEGYALALKRVIEWVKSGRKLEEYFPVHKAAFEMIPEWKELQELIEKLK